MICSALDEGYKLKKEPCTSTKLDKLYSIIVNATGNYSDNKEPYDSNYDVFYHIGQVAIPSFIFILYSLVSNLKSGAIAAAISYISYELIFSPKTVIQITDLVHYARLEYDQCQEKLKEESVVLGADSNHLKVD